MPDTSSLSRIKQLAQQAYGDGAYEIVLARGWARIMCGGQILCHVATAHHEPLESLERQLRRR